MGGCYGLVFFFFKQGKRLTGCSALVEKQAHFPCGKISERGRGLCSLILEYVYGVSPPRQYPDVPFFIGLQRSECTVKHLALHHSWILP